VSQRLSAPFILFVLLGTMGWALATVVTRTESTKPAHPGTIAASPASPAAPGGQPGISATLGATPGATTTPGPAASVGANGSTGHGPVTIPVAQLPFTGPIPVRPATAAALILISAGAILTATVAPAESGGRRVLVEGKSD